MACSFSLFHYHWYLDGFSLIPIRHGFLKSQTICSRRNEQLTFQLQTHLLCVLKCWWKSIEHLMIKINMEKPHKGPHKWKYKLFYESNKGKQTGQTVNVCDSGVVKRGLELPENWLMQSKQGFCQFWWTLIILKGVWQSVLVREIQIAGCILKRCLNACCKYNPATSDVGTTCVWDPWYC